MNPENVVAVIRSLFERAKSTDEFEYVSTLMRMRGIESAGWDTLEETNVLFSDLTGLMESPIREDTRIRLALLLYSHLTEVEAIYLILINMIQVIDGKRYSFDPFGHLYRPRNRARISQIPPSAKSVINHLKTVALEKHEQDVEALLNRFFNDSIRNAFFHSDYTLYGNEFRSRNGHFDLGDGTNGPSVPIGRLYDQINDGMIFYQAFMEVFVDALRSYTTDVRTTGRIHGGDERIPLTIHADENGLRGISSNNIGSQA